ncbi:hypothetical protein BV898_05439 [Hypsibius exemplaris]|uniref:Uncharacterized protein n=1 Tax=Hypsibius exemplaris TaxID=2072580 RepID=A0A1W0WZH7_HYPEX|nr:hypothetical protein BV898_05439 [Hypsibius exemplaris]
MTKLPNIIINLRCLLLLLVGLVSYNYWLPIHKEATKHLRRLYTNSPVLLTKHRRLARTTLFAVFGLQFIWDVCDWTVFFAKNPNVTLVSTNYGVYGYQPPSPLADLLYTWQWIILHFALHFVPFLLCQQIYMYGILATLLLHKMLRTLTRELQREIDLLDCKTLAERTGIHMERQIHRLGQWEQMLMDANRFAKTIHSGMGWFFFTAHTFDVLTLLIVASWVLRCGIYSGGYGNSNWLVVTILVTFPG